MSTSILDRIRKLLALAESSNVHEAAAATAKAQELMTRHRIELAELEVSAGEAAEEPVLEGDLEVLPGRKLWREMIAGGLVEANGCGVYFARRRGARPVTLRIVGTAQAAGLVRYMYAFLVAEVERLGQREAAAARARGERISLAWHNSFRLGAASELRRRLIEANDQARVGASGGALMRLDAAAERVDQRMTSLGLKKPRAAKSRHSAAFAAGRTAGAGISLDQDQDRPALPAGAQGALRSET